MSTTIRVGGTHPSGKSDSRLAFRFELQGALAVSRNLGVLASRLPKIEQTAMATLRRRLYTQARRDIQAEYSVGAQRIAKDLRTRVQGDIVSVTGYFRGIGLRQFGARDLRKSRRGVSYTIFSGHRSREPKAFFASLKRGGAAAGNEHVVQRLKQRRVMTAGRYKGKVRNVLETEYGPTVAQMLRKGRRPERLADFARGVLRAEVERLLRVYDPDGSYLNSINSEASP